MLNSEEKWEEAARKGKAADFVATLSAGYHTQLGRWFHDGQELSNGQWQRIALSRVFMPSEAEILVLDEPTASIDAETEAEIFDHFQSLTKDKMVVLISHRFSTVRRADTIAVLDKGRVIEKGSHEELEAVPLREATLQLSRSQTNLQLWERKASSGSRPTK